MQISLQSSPFFFCHGDCREYFVSAVLSLAVAIGFCLACNPYDDFVFLHKSSGLTFIWWIQTPRDAFWVLDCIDLGCAWRFFNCKGLSFFRFFFSVQISCIELIHHLDISGSWILLWGLLKFKVVDWPLLMIKFVPEEMLLLIPWSLMSFFFCSHPFGRRTRFSFVMIKCARHPRDGCW